MTTFERRILANGDDGYVWEGDSTFYSDDAAGVYVSDGSGDNDWGGFRFNNVTVPKGVTITTAYMTLRARANVTGAPANLRLYGAAEDDCAAWAAGHRPWPGASGTTPTTAYVAWNPAAWVAATDYNSPEIKTIIAEITSRAGWVSGNDLGIMWWPNADKAGTNYYRVTDYRNDTATAALLHIEYTSGNPWYAYAQQ
jgi:hypothetical protein